MPAGGLDRAFPNRFQAKCRATSRLNIRCEPRAALTLNRCANAAGEITRSGRCAIAGRAPTSVFESAFARRFRVCPRPFVGRLPGHRPRDGHNFRCRHHDRKYLWIMSSAANGAGQYDSSRVAKAQGFAVEHWKRRAHPVRKLERQRALTRVAEPAAADNPISPSITGQIGAREPPAPSRLPTADVPKACERTARR